MDIEDLPEWLQDMLDSCPRSGGGVHSWLFNTARQLHWHCLDKVQLADLLEERSAGCGRDVPRREIEAAVLDSEGAMWRPGESKAQRDGEDEDEERPEIKRKRGRRPPGTKPPCRAGPKSHRARHAKSHQDCSCRAAPSRPPSAFAFSLQNPSGVANVVLGGAGAVQ